MKIWLFSDLHLRHANIPIARVLPSIPEADVCVVAGDLVEGDPVAGVQWLKIHIRPKMRIVYVLGNHEFYGTWTSMERSRALAAEAARGAGIDLLDDTTVTIDGVQFIGSTLWTDFNLMSHDGITPERAMADAAKWVSDFRVIRVNDASERIWTPQMSVLRHQQSCIWLDRELQSAHMPVVVISHHAPHPGSVAPKFARDSVTPAFVSDLSDMIHRHQPALWVHGHTHNSFDYAVGSTRIICNPRGYGDENAGGFDPSLVLTVAVE